jgi:hypothetical protein
MWAVPPEYTGGKASGRLFLLTLNPSLAGGLFSGFGGDPVQISGAGSVCLFLTLPAWGQSALKEVSAFRDQLTLKWNPPPGATPVKLTLYYKPDGLMERFVVGDGRPYSIFTDPASEAASQASQASVMNFIGPYVTSVPFRREDYATWRVVEIVFDPQDVARRKSQQVANNPGPKEGAKHAGPLPKQKNTGSCCPAKATSGSPT